METFSALLTFCWGESGGFPSQMSVTRSFDVFFDLRLSNRLSKQLRPRRFETPSRSLWRHCNAQYRNYEGHAYNHSITKQNKTKCEPWKNNSSDVLSAAPPTSTPLPCHSSYWFWSILISVYCPTSSAWRPWIISYELRWYRTQSRTLFYENTAYCHLF